MAAMSDQIELPIADNGLPGTADGKKVLCALTGHMIPRRNAIPLESVRPTLVDRIARDHPHLPADALISRDEVGRYRALYVEEILKAERGELSELDKQVAESLNNHETISEDVEEDYDEERTLGERMSDHLASFGSSWWFLISFATFMAIWMMINLGLGQARAFDTYPFILLNLMLSTLAAIQAPIIMMSQKRTEQKDRLRSRNDYQVNLKAELEIRHLHEKFDYMLTKQWQRLAEIQQIQLEIMQELVPRRKVGK
jgi:uncharacterized membrane protein